MVDVCGYPFLEWVVRRLTRERILDIVLSVGHKAEIILNWTTARTPLLDERLRCHRELQPLGTGGGIADTLDDIATQYVVILNGDTLILADFLPMLQRLAKENLHGLILARLLNDTGRYGRLGVESGRLIEFQEKQPGKGLINAGVYVFKTKWLRENLPKGASSFEIDILPAFLKNGAEIGVEVTDAPFIDIGTPETLAAASDFVQSNEGYFK